VDWARHHADQIAGKDSPWPSREDEEGVQAAVRLVTPTIGRPSRWLASAALYECIGTKFLHYAKFEVGEQEEVWHIWAEKEFKMNRSP